MQLRLECAHMCTDVSCISSMMECKRRSKCYKIPFTESTGKSSDISWWSQVKVKFNALKACLGPAGCDPGSGVPICAIGTLLEGKNMKKPLTYINMYSWRAKGLKSEEGMEYLASECNWDVVMIRTVGWVSVLSWTKPGTLKTNASCKPS